MIKRKLVYGYQIVNGEVVLQPAESPIVVRVFRLYQEGLSYQKISDQLNQEKLPYSAEGQIWDKHKIKRLLENPRYIGEQGFPPLWTGLCSKKSKLGFRVKPKRQRKDRCGQCWRSNDTCAAHTAQDACWAWAAPARVKTHYISSARGADALSEYWTKIFCTRFTAWQKTGIWHPKHSIPPLKKWSGLPMPSTAVWNSPATLSK